jgi:hypothetical protein
MNNFQDNSSFGFNNSNHDPFDPFGLGSDNSQGTSTSSSQAKSGDQTQSDSDNKTTQTTPKSTQPPKKQEPKKDDGIRVRTVAVSDNDEGNQPEEDKTPANFKIGSKAQKIRIKLKPHNLNFNEEYFLQLLAGSISLNRDEKKRILDSIPNLRQSQINQLIEIFEDERTKFAELPEKHKKELEKLDKKHHIEWMTIEDEYLQGEKQQEDEAKADEIRKKLGL